jgi:hypothetical protein
MYFHLQLKKRGWQATSAQVIHVLTLVLCIATSAAATHMTGGKSGGVAANMS